MVSWEETEAECDGHVLGEVKVVGGTDQPKVDIVPRRWSFPFRVDHEKR